MVLRKSPFPLGPGLSEHPVDQARVVVGAVPTVVADAPVLGQAGLGAGGAERLDHGTAVQDGRVAVGVADEIFGAANRS